MPIGGLYLPRFCHFLAFELFAFLRALRVLRGSGFTVRSKAMIVDHRTYNVKIGKLNEFLKLYETEFRGDL